MTTNNHDYVFNLMLLNGIASGKTSIVERFVHGEFCQNFRCTMGIDFKTKCIELEGKKIKLIIWDTPGQERHTILTTMHFPQINGFILTYDITSGSCFEGLSFWIKLIKEKASPYAECIIAGNKCDLDLNRQVTKKMVEKLSLENNITWIECSAKTNSNINELFETLTKKIFFNERLFEEIFFKNIGFKSSDEIENSIQFGIINYLIEIDRETKLNCDLSIQDFQSDVAINYPNDGSKTTFKHGYHDFKLVVYGAEGFRHLRRMCNLKEKDTMDFFNKKHLSIGSDSNVMNQKFLLNYLDLEERDFFKSILVGYGLNITQNMMNNQISLLPIIYGMYSYYKLGLLSSFGSILRDNSIGVVLMHNPFNSEIIIHEIYNIKGALSEKASEQEKEKFRFKDLDFLEKYPNGIFLDSVHYDMLINCLKRDCSILESFNIINYSFILGIHEFSKSDNNNQFQLNKKNKLNPNLASKENGERLILQFGIMNIFEKYSLKTIFNNSLTLNDQNRSTDPTSYAINFIEFLSKRVFKKMI